MKALLPSSSAAALLGPKARMPAFSSSSTTPAVSGSSGPTTTKSMVLAFAHSTTCLDNASTASFECWFFTNLARDHARDCGCTAESASTSRR